MHLTNAHRKAYDVHHAGYLGRLLEGKVHVIKGIYDFAVQAGTVGTQKMVDVYGNTILIPSGAIVKQVILDMKTAVVSTSNDGTLALTLNSSGDLLAAVDADTLTNVLRAGIPVGSAGTAVKATADRNLVMEIAVHAFTAGVFDVYVEYYYIPVVS